MTKFNPTAGPWRIGDAGHTVFGPPNGNPAPKVIASDLSRSDARLIAGAPAMLKALEFFLAHYEAKAHLASTMNFGAPAEEALKAVKGVKEFA